jgi:hypothetical protein
MSDEWLLDVERRMRAFADEHHFVYEQSARQVAASFEIGCFHALLEFYKDEFVLLPQQLTTDGEYRYLTSPSGNPSNFSFIQMEAEDGNYELRQQVRVCSHLHGDIAVTPDLLVIAEGAEVHAKKRTDYASGKRSFFYVDSTSVVAAHECKSMVPFPELLVGFLGMLMTTHSWLEETPPQFIRRNNGRHLAPSLFIGGDARGIHLKMIEGMEKTFPINIVVGLHSGALSLLGGRPLRRLERAEPRPNGATEASTS